jgi:hypothetical protein
MKYLFFTIRKIYFKPKLCAYLFLKCLKCAYYFRIAPVFLLYLSINPIKKQCRKQRFLFKLPASMAEQYLKKVK